MHNGHNEFNGFAVFVDRIIGAYSYIPSITFFCSAVEIYFQRKGPMEELFYATITKKDLMFCISQTDVTLVAYAVMSILLNLISIFSPWQLFGGWGLDAMQVKLLERRLVLNFSNSGIKLCSPNCS